MRVFDHFILNNSDNLVEDRNLNISFHKESGDQTEDYFIKPDHRNGANGNKSQWTVSMEDEINTFVYGYPECQRGEYSWGLCLHHGEAVVLGKTPLNENSRIAKFENKANVPNNPWHGYPADYFDDPTHDTPPLDILTKMWNIKKSIAIKISKGKGRAWRE